MKNRLLESRLAYEDLHLTLHWIELERDAQQAQVRQKHWLRGLLTMVARLRGRLARSNHYNYGRAALARKAV